MYAAGRVPPELWIKIIRAATRITAAFDTTTHDALPPGGEPALHSQAMYTMICESIVTKAAISLVCKTWNSICLEFLYECIIVRDAMHLPLLVELLSRTHPGASRWVRRVDFVYLVPRQITRRGGVSYSDRQLVHAASKLIRQCRNLRIFSCRTPGDYMDGGVLKDSFHSLARALMRVAGTLESVEWCPHWDADASLLLKLTQHCSHLRLLLSPETSSAIRSLGSDSGMLCGHAFFGRAEELIDDSSSDESIDDSSTPEGSLTSPYLHTLAYHHTGVWRPGQHGVPPVLSSLRHVVVNNTRPELLQSFLLSNPQVDTLTFRRGAFRSMERAEEEFIAPEAVHTLIFPIQELPMAPISFPHVRRVGLKGMESMNADLYDYAFNQFVGGNGTDLFPSLKLIRFMDAPLARNLEKRKLQFKLWHYRCSSKGVQLEDERGQLLAPERL